MLTFVIWAVGIILIFMILGAMLEGFGIALGGAALAGFSIYRLFKGAWNTGRGTKEKLGFTFMAALIVFAIIGWAIVFIHWLFT